MSEQHDDSLGRDDNRREFIRGSSLFLASALPGGVGAAEFSKDQELRISLIGCGRSGIACLKRTLHMKDISANVVALADVFPDRLQQCVRNLKGRFPDQFQVDTSTRFTGPDAYRQLLAIHSDLVIIASTPAFRPAHLQAAISAGRNAFLLNPVAADAQGATNVLETLRCARQSGIWTQISADSTYSEAALTRIRSGVIGDLSQIVYQAPIRAEAFRRRSTKESDLEFQVRNSGCHSQLVGPMAAKHHMEHAGFLERLLCSELLACEVITPVDTDAGKYTSRLHLDFGNGQQVVSHCELSAELTNFPRHMRVIGTDLQYDLVSERLLDVEGHVVKRFARPPTPDASRVHELIQDIATKRAIDAPISNAQSCVRILQAMESGQPSEATLS